MLNAWRDIREGWYLNIYAGAWERSDWGVLFVDNLSIDGHQSWEDFFTTPTEAGAVRIVAATGYVLTLRSTNGTQYIFDVATDTWLEPPVTPTVVVTPPTAVPTVAGRFAPTATP